MNKKKKGKRAKKRRTATKLTTVDAAIDAGIGILDGLEELRDALFSLQEKILEVEEGGFGGVHVNEGGGNARLARPSRPANLVHIVLDLPRHRKVDHMLDLRKI